MNYRSVAEEIFLAGVERVLPDRLISNSMSVSDGCLIINDLVFNSEEIKNIYVIGAGKASALMGAEVEKILGARITEGHIIVKYGHACDIKRIIVTEAGHPVPDLSGFAATRSVLEICRKAGLDDLVICLLSGGGSALLPDFPEGSSPEEIMLVNDLLVRSGASINEINSVRKHLSEVKGGQLARAVFPAKLLSLVLSDVTGDPLDVIASGPTVPDPTTFSDALGVLEKYNLSDSMPEGIISYLSAGDRGDRAESPKPGDPVFKGTYNILIGNNKIALEASAARAGELDLKAEIIDDRLQGDFSSVAQYIIDKALKYQADEGMARPMCLLFGGEPTVTVSGKGSGGRNQHLALYCSKLLKNYTGITILSAGTDGSDGPTEAAGAVVDCSTWDDAVSDSIQPGEYLERFDSFNFFSQTGGHIITGPTMTNVMDIIVVIVD